ncbi:MAG: Flp pilus assembly complex ATPase component TadA [Gemmatimonadetes bacterium]|nr:Flp pilus assembly complex ATPase component TadA [Gemmatimonadota bacterium]
MRFSDSASVFLESRFQHAKAETGLTRAVGMNYSPSEHWDISGNLELGNLSDRRTKAETERRAVSATVTGEMAVLRLLDKSARLYRLTELGMGKKDLDAFRTLIRQSHGIILVTGPTGSGKSTTLYASCLSMDRVEKNVISLEDPVEYHIPDANQMQIQNEAGITFATQLRSILRLDPDVILVGEMRDFETIETAITAAETGHLVMSTLHTLDATETINRIISVFPPYQQKQVRLQLSAILKAVISQRLVPRADGKGRVPALEVLVSTSRIRECIADKERTKEMHDAISKGFTTYGMQTFDQSLMSLVKRELISYEEALNHVSNPDDFALRFRGIASTSDGSWDDFEEGQGAEEKPSEESKKQLDPDFIERF